MIKNDFLKFIKTITIYAVAFLVFVIGVNYSVDASDAIRPDYTNMAKAALEGQSVAVSDNYNDRVYQRYIVDNMSKLPETIVIGSSRGMYLGSEITGKADIYNSCVAGATIADYFAVLGLYEQRFNNLPKNIIIEVSPWVFYKDNPESRWMDDKEYLNSAKYMYKEVTGKNLVTKKNKNKENPYISISYFRYNIEQLLKMGNDVFNNEAIIEIPDNSMADLPDGTIRYPLNLEYESEYRMEIVKDVYGPCTYQNSDQMKEIDETIQNDFESLITYLRNKGIDITFYIQPFSVTQSHYIFEENLNPAYQLVENYMINLANEESIDLKGSYNPVNFNLTDNDFIDFMHLDKKGTSITWSQSYR